MALGTNMKLLVEDIVASREDRGKALGDIRKDTHHILADADTMLKDFTKEGQERAAEVKRIGCEVKSFLKSSRERCQKNFEATMKTVKASLEDVRNDSQHARHAGETIIKDAKALLENIAKGNKEQAKELQEELKKSEQKRQADFRGIMSAIKDDLKDGARDVSRVRKDAKDMVSRYHHSRMSAQKHWASLSSPEKKAKKHKSEE